MKYLVLVIALAIVSCGQTNKLESILNKGSDSFRKTMASSEHEIQIIYGEINEAEITHHIYGDTSQYFYPASTIKMLNAFTSLEWLNERSLTSNAILNTDSSEHHPRKISYDSIFQDSILIKNILKKIFVYSDNQASNLLYNLMGKDYVNSTLSDLGIKSRVIHQLGESAFAHTPESNSWTFLGSIVQKNQTFKVTPTKQQFVSNLKPNNQRKGSGYINQDGELVQEAFDFTPKNYVPLFSLLGVLERVIKHKSFSEDNRFSFNKNDRNQLEDIMKLRPSDLPYPIDTLADNYVKFLMFGEPENKSYPESLTIMNKVGWAYGYLSDIAYFYDSEKNIEFFLAATIHVNENQIFMMEFMNMSQLDCLFWMNLEG